MAGELVEEEGDGRGGGVVAGEQQRQHLVADLLVGEAHALAVLRLHQQPEDVLACLPGASAAGDLAQDDVVERAPNPAQAGEGASRAAHDLEEVLALVEREAALERCRDVDPAPIRVQPEQCPHRDPHGHVPRPVVEVDPVAGPPAAKRALGLVAHHGRRRCDPLAVKDRDHDLAGAVVVLAVGGQEPVTDQRDQVPETAVAPAELVAVRDQDEAVGLGAEHEHVDRVEDPDREDGAVLLVGGQKDRQRVAAHPLGARDARQLWAGRQRAVAGGPPLDAQVVPDPHQRVGAQFRGRVEGHRAKHSLAGWTAKRAPGRRS